MQKLYIILTHIKGNENFESYEVIGDTFYNALKNKILKDPDYFGITYKRDIKEENIFIEIQNILEDLSKCDIFSIYVIYSNFSTEILDGKQFYDSINETICF